MIDLTPFLEKRRSLAAFPKALHSAEEILKDVVDPMLEALRRTGRWVSLDEAMRQSGRSIAFFRAKLDSLGGRCRLEVWAEEGLAMKVGRPWLISPSVIPSGKQEMVQASREEMTAEEIPRQLEESEE
ncbi:MAG TPA: hypothetical protein VFQ76_15080 [Longimicrobiaceae bacterium]|nr:hypothetical protein [Longimicrobiaceae bacterium]